MAIYAILSLKGGVAKTTTAIHLAACAVSHGRPVTVIDADEERSAEAWANLAADRGGSGGALPFRVVPAERDSLGQQIRASAKSDTVIVDTPPNNREIFSRVAMAASHIVVPVAPTGIDVNRLKPTLELLRDVEATRGRLDVAILLTCWNDRTILAREAATALKGFPVLRTRIRELERYAQSFGTLPSYLDEYRSVWKEIASARS